MLLVHFTIKTTIDISLILVFAALQAILYNRIGDVGFIIATGKSAQFGLHPWLPFCYRETYTHLRPILLKHHSSS